MLIATLLPLLSRYSLGFNLVAGPDETVTLTIIPRKAEGSTAALDGHEARPISITARADEIDAELARGSEGALGQLIASRKTLADQLAEQRQAAEDAKATAAKAKASPAPSRTATSSTATRTPAPTSPPADASADEPATLW